MAGVHQQGRRPCGHEARLCVAVDAAVAQVAAVLRHARQAVRSQALRFGRDQGARGDPGHDGVGAGAQQRSGGEVGEFRKD